MRPLPRKSGVRISIFGARAVRRAHRAMQSTKCWAPPSRRSSRSTEVITTYFRPMSAMVRRQVGAARAASGGFGRPWATSQNEQRRVHTSPRIMKVAVPWPKHSWMFGQLASSHTVTRRFSRSLALRWRTALPRRDAHADPRRLAQHRRVGELHRRARDLVARHLLDARLQRRRSVADDGQRDGLGAISLMADQARWRRGRSRSGGGGTAAAGRTARRGVRAAASSTASRLRRTAQV